MVWGFFGHRSYAGSNLERLIQGRVGEIRGMRTAECTNLCARALLRERAEVFEPVTKSGDQTAQPISEEARELMAHGLAHVMLVLIISSTAAAEIYGKQIDELSSSNSLAALALANCL